MPKTLQLLKFSRFQFHFHHDYTGDLLIFDLIFDSIFTEPPPPDLVGRLDLLQRRAEVLQLVLHLGLEGLQAL